MSISSSSSPPLSFSTNSAPPSDNNHPILCKCIRPTIATKAPDPDKSDTTRTPYRFCSSCDAFMGFVRRCSADLPHQQQEEGGQWGLRKGSVLEPIMVEIRVVPATPSPATSPMTSYGSITKEEGETSSKEKDNGCEISSLSKALVSAKRQCPFPSSVRPSSIRRRPFNPKNMQEARETITRAGKGQMTWLAPPLRPPIPVLVPPHQPWSSPQTSATINLNLHHQRHTPLHLQPPFHTITTSTQQLDLPHPNFFPQNNLHAHLYNILSLKSLQDLSHQSFYNSPASLLLNPPLCPCGTPARSELDGELGEVVLLFCWTGRCGFFVRVRG